MLRDECPQFEDCLARGETPSEQLRRHATHCPDCSLLASVAALATSPTPTGADDPILRATLAAAVELADQRAARAEGRRKLVPLLIGLCGYLLGFTGLAASLLRAPVSGVASGLPGVPSVALPAAPPPSPATVAVVVVASLLWMAGVVAFTRRRRGAQVTGR